jgi:hypothetical protein
LDTAAPESAPTALADLIAAGLVSHEMIGDPGRLGEAEALRALCGLVAGPVWRIEPYHYAFRPGPADLGGGLGGLPPADWAAALEAALQAALGEAVWVNATDLLPDAVPDAPLLLLRAQAAAVAGALEPAGPELQAVIGARFAAAAARLAAGDTGALAERLAGIEARQAAILEGLQAQAAQGVALARVTEALGAVLDRLDDQAAALAAHAGREDMVAGRLAELAAMAGSPAAFQETLGVTLAEFLAQLERRAEAAPTRVPQFS